MRRSRTATPQGPGATKDAASSRNPPTTSPPSRSDTRHPVNEQQPPRSPIRPQNSRSHPTNPPTGLTPAHHYSLQLSKPTAVHNPFCEHHPQARVSIESLSSAEVRHGLAEFEMDAAMTYLDDDTRGGGLRRLPLYEERYVLPTPVDGPLATAATARWAQAAALPLCLLGPRMRNRRIIDECFAADGATTAPAIGSDSVAGLYAHLPGGRWSSVISHAWLHMFGVPDGMRVVPLGGGHG
ncbi:LysR substrate-binding domain-containing protein [Streptomyces sp. NPDC056661]|uniref:LysR substrate-binding domain-containing protein n=1 Tax=Streptomyces sp. NPDC056661 TaxID=3345898 RepID=UPI0036954605